MRSVRGIENRLQLQGGDVGSRYADCSKEEEMGRSPSRRESKPQGF